MFHRRLVVLLLALALLAIASSSAPSLAESKVRERIVLHGGDLVLFPMMAAPSDCPFDYVCLWAHPEYIGGMVAFRDCCNWYNLADVAFNNNASSWRNRKSVDAKIADFQDGNGDRFCLNDGGQSGNMGNWDNRATSLKVFSGSGAC